MNTAIIVAAGTGERFGGDIPKQFQNVSGKPVLFHTLLRFQQCSAIDKIVLVVAQDRIETISTLQDSFSKLTRIVSGGDTRSESVCAGLDVIEDDGIVAVHDGARPLVTPQEIANTVAAAEKTGAACLTVKVTDTIKKIVDGRIVGTVDRENLRKAVTPQCFKKEILVKAFQSRELDGATDECFLVEKLGVEIISVEGSPRNIKITVEDDLKIAEMFLEDALSNTVT